MVNAQLPVDTIGYLHRAGRTARMGQHGTVLNFLSPYDVPLYNKISSAMRKKDPNLNETMKPPPDVSKVREKGETGRKKRRQSTDPWLRENTTTFVSKLYRSDFEID